ncbi:MAG: hypothetical protein ACOC9Y_09915 [Chloroflexota bacterium]
MKHTDSVNALIQHIAAASETSFTDEERARVRKNIEDKQKQAATLRTVRLENGDEPGTVFSAYREEG